MTRILAFGLAAALAMTMPLAAQETPAPEGAEVYFVNLEDGAKVTSPLTVIFGLKGMGVAPAGTEKAATGHHHLLVNRPPFGQGDGGAEELSYGLPADDHHKHFGGGQTQGTLDLPPGQHTLQLVMGDANHVPHDPPVMSEVITITVE
ncbi:MAG: rod shape-determining protein RodA [Roseovarius sp.]|nr:rod shape-determining protein RodA [Roseovarius sp.]